MNRTRRSLLLPLGLASGLTALALVNCGDSSPSVPPPGWNVLLLTLDTTRADRLGCYGHAAAETPHLDRLAREGARFERTISTAGITPMSHSSILSGLNNYSHGLRVFANSEGTVGNFLEPEITTLPELLRDRGWSTGATISAYPVSKAYGLDQGFDYFSAGDLSLDELDLDKQQRHATMWSRGGKTVAQRRGDFTVSDALGWLDGAGDDPWCMWVHLFDVHDFSVVPPQEYLDEHGLEFPTEDSPRLRANQQHAWREKVYDPEMTWMDSQVGRLVDWLEAHDELDNTLIVVTADHGQGLTEGLQNHGWGKHRLLYDWCLRVPLIVRVPGQDPVVVPQQVRTIDVLPTLCQLLNIPPPREQDGLSLVDLMQGAKEAEPRIAYAEALNTLDDHSPKPKALGEHYDNLFCATDGRWKLIVHATKQKNSKLFDLNADPRELNNLYAPDHPETKRLMEFLKSEDAFTISKARSDGQADADKLNALGYTGAEQDDPDMADPEEGEKQR